MARTTGSNRYTWAEFLRAITPAEYGTIAELAQSTGTTAVIRQARYTVALWQAENLVDFNEARTVTAITWLVANTSEWTGARATALAGG